MSTSGSTAPARRGLPLGLRWMLAMLLAGSVPLALFAARALALQRAGLEAIERELEISLGDAVTSEVEETLARASEATHRVGALLTEARIDDGEARLALAQEALGSAGPLEQVAIYDARGALLDAIVGANGAPPAAPEEHLAAEQQRARAGWLPPEMKPGGAVLRYFEPVVRDGALRAYVLGQVPLRALSDSLEGLSRDHLDGRPDGVLLVDAELHLLAGGGGVFAPGTSLAGKDVFAQAQLGPDAFRRAFGYSAEFNAAGGEPMVGTVRPMPERGWAVAVRRDREAAYAGLAATRRSLLLSLGAVAVLALALGASLARRTTRPIAQLRVLAGAFARREFSARSPVRTGDELQDLGDTLEDMADRLDAGEKELARRVTVEAQLSRFLPAEVARRIAQGERELTLGGERRRVSILFADIVGFTGLSERASPQATAALLNEVFSVLTEVVFRHGGIVDKFIGDCVMAIFGAPQTQPDYAARALAAAEDMHRFVEACAATWRARYGPDLQLSIGVSAGEALVGNLGSASRMEYTAIGDVVNVAARLESMARPGQTLCTGEVAHAVGAAFPLVSLGTQPVRGKQEPVEVFALA